MIESSSELLTDVQIANVCYEVEKQFLLLNPDFRFEFFYPRSAQLLRSNCRDRTAELVRAVTNPGITFIILNVGNCHWVLLIIDSRVDQWYYFDPLGVSCPPSIVSSIHSVCPSFSFTDVGVRMQFESFQCGVWVSWFCETILDNLMQRVTIDNILWKELICTEEHMRVFSHTTFIAGVRESYSKILFRAFEAGNLGWY